MGVKYFTVTVSCSSGREESGSRELHPEGPRTRTHEEILPFPTSDQLHRCGAPRQLHTSSRTRYGPQNLFYPGEAINAMVNARPEDIELSRLLEQCESAAHIERERALSQVASFLRDAGVWIGGGSLFRKSRRRGLLKTPILHSHMQRAMIGSDSS